MREKHRRAVPYLRKLREGQRLSQRRLAERAGISRHTINRIEAGSDARAGTVEALAAALDALPEDLTGKPGMPPEQMEAYLDHLLTEKKTHAPGDPIYDEDPTAGMTDLELGAYVRKNARLRAMVDAIVRQEEERRNLEEEHARDAG